MKPRQPAHSAPGANSSRLCGLEDVVASTGFLSDPHPASWRVERFKDEETTGGQIYDRGRRPSV